MLRNSIFTNPVGWAESLIGSKLRYALAIVWQILGGLLTIVAAGALCCNWEIALLVAIPALFFAMGLPICYVIALRKLVVERRHYMSGVNSAEADD